MQKPNGLELSKLDTSKGKAPPTSAKNKKGKSKGSSRSVPLPPNVWDPSAATRCVAARRKRREEVQKQRLEKAEALKEEVRYDV